MLRYDISTAAWAVCHCKAAADLGEVPSPRSQHAACNIADRYMIVFGGESVAKDSAEVNALPDISEISPGDSLGRDLRPTERVRSDIIIF